MQPRSTKTRCHRGIHPEIFSGMKRALGLFILLFPISAVAAECDRALLQAVSALARTSYTWETTTRQRFHGETTEPRLNANAARALQGRTAPNGFTQITLLPSRDLAVAVTALFHEGDVVAQTPLGWRRRMDLGHVPGGDREVTVEGKKVRLARVFSEALKATTLLPLTEELFDLIVDLKSCRTERGLIVAELRDATIEKWWGDVQAKRAPEIHGTVIFKLGDEGVTEYYVVLGIGFPNPGTKKVAWTLQQWSTRITGIGSTTIDPPEEALNVLDQ